MATSIVDAIHRWAQVCELPVERFPSARQLFESFGTAGEALRPPVAPQELRAWERRHDVVLPTTLRAWLLISNGFYHGLPLIHPVEAIGPMVLFGELPGFWVQPESWFEIGNPNIETVGVDLAYRWPAWQGDSPIITSGDRNTLTAPRVIARGFASWFVQLLEHGGREFWREPGFQALGDAWVEHRLHVPRPSLPEHLLGAAVVVEQMMADHADERKAAKSLDLDIFEVEQILRYLQHRTQTPVPMPLPSIVHQRNEADRASIAS